MRAFAVFAGLLLALLAGPRLHAQPIPGAPSHLRVMLIDNYPPFAWVNGDTGKLQGYEVDRWRLFARHTGIAVELEAASWDVASTTVLSGRADVIDPIYRNPAREASFDFSEPYASLPATIYVERRARGVHDLADLRGRDVGVARSSICANTLDTAGDTGQRRYPDPQALLQAAAEGHLDVFCMDENRFQYYQRKFPGLDHFDRAFLLTTGQFQWAVRKGNTALREAIVQGMAQITPDEMETLRRDWLASPPVATTYQKLAGAALIAVLALVVLMVLWVWMLRRAVARRTTQLRAEEDKLRALFDASPFAMWVKDLHGVYLESNERALQSLNLGREQIVGHTDLELYGPEYTAEIREMDACTIHEGQRHAGLMTFDHGTGPRQLQIINVPLRDAGGQIYGTLGTGRDITDEARTEAELRLAAVAFQTQEALLVMDAHRIIQRLNQAFEDLTGFTAADLVGKPSTTIRSSHHDPAFFARIWAEVDAHGYWQGEYWVRVKQGRPRVVRMALSAARDESRTVSHYLASMIDLTSEREAHASVDHMTFFDPLTDLPNRHYLHGRLQHVLNDATQSAESLLIIDLDHFKRVNDLRGHASGDWLLAQVAQRLRRILEPGAVLSRFGGGTFALLVGTADRDTTPAEAASRSAEQVRAALAEPFVLADGVPVTVTASIGWTLLVPGQGTADGVLKEAELAMYDAKAGGRDQARRFMPAMQAQLERHEAIVQDLRAAIETDALELYLQAQTDRSGRIIGAEALLRWTRPNGERVSPALFIPIAEENSLIVPIGDWVLKRACEWLAAWAQQPAKRDLSLAVNVSAKQFACPSFIDSLGDVLRRTGADPSRLKIEVTESAILDDIDEAAGKLTRLRGQGMRVSLDDFGTGYSSLAYLSRLPLDQLKIDQSFVARLPDSPNDAMVARTIIGMGHGLGFDVIAEGVEAPAQREFLLAHGCNAFQGYLISRPVPLAEFEALLHATNGVTSRADS